MKGGIETIDVMNDALYITSGSKYADGSTVGGSGVDSKGQIMGSNWTVIFNSTSTAFEIKGIHTVEIDLTGLDHAVIAPIALSTYQCEAPSLIGKGGSALFRDFVWITTTPLDKVDLLDRVDEFSPVAPYQRFNNAATSGMLPALIAKEQLFTGRAELWASDTTISETNGFIRPLWKQDFNIGNLASCRKLYYNRIIYGYGDKSAGAVPSFWLDMPARHDQIAYSQLEMDENSEAMTMIRSYQAPQGSEDL